MFSNNIQQLFTNKTVIFILIINLVGAIVIWLKTLVYKAIVSENLDVTKLLGVTLNLGKKEYTSLLMYIIPAIAKTMIFM